MTSNAASASQCRLAESLARKTIPSLDGLRAVAVLLVISNHMEVPYAPHGRGVLTFFVLSGFLITWLMLKEADRERGISIRNFYVRRVLRIFPAFYLYLALLILGHLFKGHLPTASTWEDYLASFFYFGNYRFALDRHSHLFVGHTWALSIEEQFYLIWPWVFVAFHQDLRKFTRLLISAIVLVDIYRIILFFGFHVSNQWLTFTFDSRVDHLLVGCLLAVLLKRGVGMQFWNFITARAWISMLPLGLMVLSIALAFRYSLAYKFAVGFVVDPLLTAILLVQVIAMGDTWMWGWLNWRLTRYLGQISYAMFLYHMLAARIVIAFLGTRSLWVKVPAVICISVVIGTLSYYLVEMKFLRLKSRFIKSPVKRAERTAVPSLQPVSI